MFAAPGTTAEPSQKVDQFIRQKWSELEITQAQNATDREWVRRVHLDLVGRIPTTGETDRFLADTRPDKREQLVDLLLQSEDHIQHFADVFDTLLMGRTDEQKYEKRLQHQWRAYLETVFRDNRRWDVVAEEILLGRPESEDKRGAAWFLYERNNQYQVIAEAISPAVFGVRIECAQCHDHMSASEILQEHYWGLVAFFNRGKNKNTKNGPRVEESAVGGFSDFADIYGSSSPNRLVFLESNEVSEKRPGKEEKEKDDKSLYFDAKISGEPRVPKFSRREKFVDEIVRHHPRISRAMVNRVWALLMGRGLVHPYDEMDSMHPPSHPELLDWLASGFEYSGFDVRRLIRNIVLCEAYQLSSVRPNGVEDPATFAWYLERPLTAEQLARSTQIALQHGNFRNDHALTKQFRQKFKDVLPKQYVATVADALYLSNNENLSAFIHQSAKREGLLRDLNDAKTDTLRAEIASLAIFGRKPTKEETDSIVNYLKKRESGLPIALEQIVWAMLTSAEFRFNH